MRHIEISLCKSVIVLAGLGNLAHQDRRGLQVPIGVGDVRMAEVGAECHEMPGDRSAIVPALLQRTNREGVTQIVNPGTATTRRPNARAFEHLAIRGMDRPVGETRSA